MCETLKISAGYAPATGLYGLTGELNDHFKYLGPAGSELRYEIPFTPHEHFHSSGPDSNDNAENWGARNWLTEAGWFLAQGGHHRYGVVTDKAVGELSGLSWRTRDGANPPINIECTDCHNVPEWNNGEDCTGEGATKDQGCTYSGWTCRAYGIMGWCSGGAPVLGMEKHFGPELKYPERSCCICGGKWEPSMADVLSKLEREQSSVKFFEDSVAGMHKSLSEAEQALVDTSETVGVASRGLRNLENMTTNNENLMLNLTGQVSTLQSNLALETKGLKRSTDRAKDLKVKADLLAAEGKKEVVVSLGITGLNYTALSSNSAILALFEASVKQSCQSGGGGKLVADMKFTSSAPTTGSSDSRAQTINAVITFVPTGSESDALKTKLDGVDLKGTVVTGVQAVNNISIFTTSGIASSVPVITITEEASNNDMVVHLEVLNKRIWAASEPEGEPSVRQAEMRVDAIEKSQREFSGRLRERVRLVLKKRLRRNVNGMRKLINKLGSCRRRAEALQQSLEPCGLEAHDAGPEGLEREPCARYQ